MSTSNPGSSPRVASRLPDDADDSEEFSSSRFPTEAHNATEDAAPRRLHETELQLEVAREMLAKANVDLSSACEQKASAGVREAGAQILLDGGAAPNDCARKADSELTSVAAEMRVPRAQLASAFEKGAPLPRPTLPMSSPGQLHSASVAARLPHCEFSRFSTDSGSWDAVSRADSNDSSWEAGPLGGPQGSWDWFGSRGSGGMPPSSLRPVDDAVMAERRAHKVVQLPGAAGGRGASDPGASTALQFCAASPGGPSSGSDPGARSGGLEPGVTASAPGNTLPPGHSILRSTSGSERDTAGGLPPTARRLSGSDAVRRASFGRLQQQLAATQLGAQRRGQLPAFDEGTGGEA